MVINCTPHDVNIYTPSGCCTYPAAKDPARAIYVRRTAGAVDGTLIYRRFTEDIVNLPDPKPGTYYIVPKTLAQACPEREDLIFPGTVVRDADGRVVGCIDFSRV